ncbi:MAG: hypothetical protein IPG59_13225 [Candidatus Melainabacteria bacterium]|nr:MAG: hypothetical protein IPG59_13225 [Candidatus Melainabacteria bacterium]
MPYESMNLLEFQRRFNSEEACLKAIFDARWLKDLSVFTVTTMMESAWLGAEQSNAVFVVVRFQSHLERFFIGPKFP